ncbi:MAG: adenylyl-sulfate kinase [Candidatus Cloacimonetes bacterium]|nr:adenylyl-sulfate kinase [Candidatus Cloacimonadota bacterium]
MATNPTPRHDTVSPEQDESQPDQQGAVVWFTGLSGSGKSTIARAVEERLTAVGKACYVLDGDVVRAGLCADLDFSPDDRIENIRRVAHVAALMADAGLLALCAFISPYCAGRDAARALLSPRRFFEVLVNCPLAECESRDVKGLYRKARAGKIEAFTGIDAPYEPPLLAELILDTTTQSVAESAEAVMKMLRDADIISD